MIPAHEGPIHVTTPTRSRPPGVRAHHTALAIDSWRLQRVLLLTSPLATLLGLALTEPAATTDQALAEAQAQKLITRAEIVAAPATPGSRVLKDLVEATPTVTRSTLERRFLALVRRAGLPRPQTNVRLAGFEVDAAWPQQQVAVEIDGYAFHHSRRAFERDRRKDAALDALGWKPIRLTWKQIEDEPEAVAIRIARALGNRR